MPRTWLVALAIWRRIALCYQCDGSLTSKRKLVASVVATVKRHMQVDVVAIATVAVHDHGGANGAFTTTLFEDVMYVQAFAGGS
jgi:hypothetical protein